MKRRGVALAGSWLAAATAWGQAREPTGPAGSLGASAAAPLELAPAPIEVTVQQARPLVAPTVETRVGGEEGRRAAGTQGDAIKALQALPGLARAGAGAGEVIAWGSAPNESRLYVDGVEIPVLYHGSGIRSVLPSGWVSTLAFLPGAYSAEYGRGLGGVVALETRALDRETWHADAQIDVLDAGALLSLAPVAGVAVGAAFRQSLVDRWLPQLERADVGSLLTVPSYRDWQAKLSAELSERERLELVHLGSHDRWTSSTPSSDPANRVRQDRALEFERWYLRYRRDDGRERVEVTPFVGIERARLGTHAVFGRSGLATRGISYGLRASQRFGWEQVSMRIGVDALGRFSRVEREGTLALPPREGDPRVFGQLPSSAVAVDRSAIHILDVAPQAELTLRSGSLTAMPGVRLDTYLIEADRVRPPQGRVPPVGSSRARLAAEPRLALSYDLDDRVRLLASAGVYHQAPDPADLSAVFGNPGLGLARSVQLALGEELRFGGFASLSLIGHYKELQRLPVRSPRPTPEIAEVLLGDGRGRSFGVQLLARQNLRAGWSGWFAWTISRSERWREDDTPRPFDYDQPHVVAAAVNKRIAGWSLSARIRYASGSPRTPVIGASLNLLTDRYEPLLGAVNSTRLPDFFQLDLRVDHTVELSGATLSVYADALNVTARSNAEDIVYGPDYRQWEYLRGLPPLLAVGARIER